LARNIHKDFFATQEVELIAKSFEAIASDCSAVEDTEVSKVVFAVKLACERDSLKEDSVVGGIEVEESEFKAGVAPKAKE
jgi:hypothetical protein